MRENKSIMKLLNEKQSIILNCEEHKNQESSRYCLNCDIFVCSECLMDDHRNHDNSEMTIQNLSRFINNLEQLTNLYDKDRILMQLKQWKNKELDMSTVELQENTSRLKRILKHQVTDQELQSVDFCSYINDFLPENQDPQSLNPKQIIQQQQKQLQHLNKDAIFNIVREQQQLMKDVIISIVVQRELIQESNLNNKLEAKLKQIATSQSNFDLKLNELQNKIQQHQQPYQQNHNIPNLSQLKQQVNKLKQDGDSYSEQIIFNKLMLESFRQEVLNQINTLTNYHLDSQKNIREQLDKSAKLQLGQEEYIDFKIQNHQQELQDKFKQQIKGIVGILQYNIPSAIFSQDSEEKQLMMKMFRNLVDQEIMKSPYAILGDGFRHSKQSSNHYQKQFQLLYRGSKDGYTAQSFHNKCDNQEATVSFILSEFGQIFGGYTSLSWEGTYSMSHSDNDAFLFQLNKRTIHQQIANHNQVIVHDKNNLLYTFGRGLDISISENCDQVAESSCIIGKNYANVSNRNQQDITYMAGHSCFKVLEIEVYSVKEQAPRYHLYQN
eukprot:403337984